MLPVSSEDFLREEAELLGVPQPATEPATLGGDSKAMSHVCGWPGCGKGFASRWTLERHARNHQPAVPGETEPTPDSFVERRLRERLKSVHAALEKAREKHAQHAKQREQAEAELLEAQQQYHQQQEEVMLLERATARLRTALPPVESVQQHGGVSGPRAAESVVET